MDEAANPEAARAAVNPAGANPEMTGRAATKKAVAVRKVAAAADLGVATAKHKNDCREFYGRVP